MTFTLAMIAAGILLGLQFADGRLAFWGLAAIMAFLSHAKGELPTSYKQMQDQYRYEQEQYQDEQKLYQHQYELDPQEQYKQYSQQWQEWQRNGNN